MKIRHRAKKKRGGNPERWGWRKRRTVGYPAPRHREGKGGGKNVGGRKTGKPGYIIEISTWKRTEQKNVGSKSVL